MSTNSSRRYWEVALALICTLLGVALTIGWEKYEQRRKARDERNRQPQVMLDQAEAKRRQLTESELASALDILNQVPGVINQNQSLDQATKRRYQALTYSGLSRVFADWATLRSGRGLARGDFPQQAQSLALQASTFAPEMPETGIALAYAFESAEAEQRDRSATKKKVKDLLAKGIDNLDTRYLAWRSDDANEEAKSFPDRVRANDLSDLLILVDIGIYFAKKAEQAPEPAAKQANISRSEEFLARAVRVSPNNAMALYGQGYLSASRGNIAQARDYYRKAIDQEPTFPKARNNWGFTFAAEGKYAEAKEQFEAAVQAAAGAPTTSLRRWLDNLGYASLEIGDNARACQVWIQASGTPGANENPRTVLGLAMCHYINGEKDNALADFRSSAAIAQDWNKSPTNSSVNPLDINWYEKEKDGPKELKIAKDLIQMDKQLPKLVSANKKA